MSTWRRIGLWLASVVLSVALFSLWLGQGSPAGFLFIFRITMMFALPVAFLYLPFVLKLKDAEGPRIWKILGSGILMGPAYLLLLGFILELLGHDPHMVWQGDGLDWGVVQCIIPALFVGCLTTLFYAIALKSAHRWPAQSRR